MSKPVISVENLSKSYTLGQIGTGTFSHDLAVWWARVRGKPNPLLRIGETDHGNRVGEEIWALKDVSFQVQQGDVLGIIGRNGAGKSTLLKILSRVTAPTSGAVKVKGRIASLLEVGTGFHPELTGRENIFLNGAILGMTKQEVTRKFDEIVDFSGVEKFIDTPVKRYSSGMYVRLAFAVAAHLESEILLVDEVLAVGDAEFQKKCLGKMGDVATKEGRTILFVSHNMAAVTILCNKSLLVNQGVIQNIGDTSEVIRIYSDRNKLPTEAIEKQGVGYFKNIQFHPEDIKSNSTIFTSVDLVLNQNISDFHIFFILQDQDSNYLIHNVIPSRKLNNELKKGLHKIKLSIPSIWLKPSNYSIFFKIVTIGKYKLRIESESFPLQVNYQADITNLQGLINPTIIWTLENSSGDSTEISSN